MAGAHGSYPASGTTGNAGAVPVLISVISASACRIHYTLCLSTEFSGIAQAATYCLKIFRHTSKISLHR